MLACTSTYTDLRMYANNIYGNYRAIYKYFGTVADYSTTTAVSRGLCYLV